MIRRLVFALGGVLLWPGAGGAAGPDGAAARAALERMTPAESNGAQRARLHETVGHAARVRGKLQEARKAYRAALAACASAGDARCRRRLLKRLARPAKGWPKRDAARYKELAAAWARADKMWNRLAKMPRRTEPPDDIDPDVFQLEAMAREIKELGRKMHDRALKARGLELEGRILAGSGYPDDELAKYREGAALCSGLACPAARRRLLGRIAGLQEKRGKLKEAYRLYAVINKEKHTELAPGLRRYRRSADLDRVCQRLQQTGGSTACLAIEREAAGHATFHDHSRGPIRPGLSKAAMREVHGEYIPLLHACLFEAARSGEVEPGERFELNWAVTNEGRVTRFEAYPSVEGLRLGDCFEQALSIFRYPRYRGERRTVTVPLAVNR